jgi:hypothetical protein
VNADLVQMAILNKKLPKGLRFERIDSEALKNNYKNTGLSLAQPILSKRRKVRRALIPGLEIFREWSSGGRLR